MHKHLTNFTYAMLRTKYIAHHPFMFGVKSNTIQTTWKRDRQKKTKYNWKIRNPDELGWDTKTKTTIYTVCLHINIYFRFSCCNCFSLVEHCSGSESIRTLTHTHIKLNYYKYFLHIFLFELYEMFKHNMPSFIAKYCWRKNYVYVICVYQQKLFPLYHRIFRKTNNGWYFTNGLWMIFHEFILYFTIWSFMAREERTSK